MITIGLQGQHLSTIYKGKEESSHAEGNDVRIIVNFPVYNIII